MLTQNTHTWTCKAPRRRDSLSATYRTNPTTSQSLLQATPVLPGNRRGLPSPGRDRYFSSLGMARLPHPLFSPSQRLPLTPSLAMDTLDRLLGLPELPQHLCALGLSCLLVKGARGLHGCSDAGLARPLSLRLMGPGAGHPPRSQCSGHLGRSGRQALGSHGGRGLPAWSKLGTGKEAVFQRWLGRQRKASGSRD